VKPPIIDFRAEDSPTESLVPMPVVVSAFCSILDWIESGRNFTDAGARASALRVLLDPVQSRYRTLAQIARDAGVSRAIVSRWLLELRDTYDVQLGLRSSATRLHCRQAQLASVKAGRHSSQLAKQHQGGSQCR
jgi:hypothetical protein